MTREQRLEKALTGLYAFVQHIFGPKYDSHSDMRKVREALATPAEPPNELCESWQWVSDTERKRCSVLKREHIYKEHKFTRPGVSTERGAPETGADSPEVAEAKRRVSICGRRVGDHYFGPSDTYCTRCGLPGPTVRGQKES